VRPQTPPLFSPQTFSLPNGNEVFVRQLLPGDKKLLAEGFEQLSPETIRKRFMNLRKGFSEKELVFLTELDGIDHFALGASVIEDGQTKGIGVARYVRDQTETQKAELAIVIVDKYQGMGLGSFLMQNISQIAFESGIEEFTGTLERSNLGMQKLLKKMKGFETQLDSEATYLQLRANLKKWKS